MDLLDYQYQKTGNEKKSYQADNHGAYGRKAPTLLLGWLHTSLRRNVYNKLLLN